MPTTLEKLQNFDIVNSEVTIWTFKKTTYTGIAAPVYTGHWVETSEALDVAVKSALEFARKKNNRSIGIWSLSSK